MNWEKVKLEDICQITGGTTPKTNRPEFWDGNIVWLSPVDLPEVGSITNVYSSQRMITNEGLASCSLRLLPVGSLVFSTRASIGKIGIVKTPLATNQGFTNFIPGEKVNVRYLAYALKKSIKAIEKLGNSTTFNEVSRTAIKNFEIPLPPLPIQQQIADTLDKADALRRKDQELLDKYDELAQAVFYEMFGDPDSYHENWDIVNLEDVCSDIVDCPHSTPLHSDNATDYACIRTSELDNGFINWSSMKFVEADEYTFRTKRLKPAHGDIVYGREGSYGEAVILPSIPKFCLGQRTMLFRPNIKKVMPMFLWWFVRSDFVYRQAVRKNNGSTVGHVNVKDIKNFKIIKPSIERQNKFILQLNQILVLRELAIKNTEKSSNLFTVQIQSYFS